MNLELLDPFRRQIPDRVDATLTLPANCHKKSGSAPTPQEAEVTADKEKQEDSPEDQEWKAAYHVGFNRRGTYLAVGHASGTVAVHDFLSRTLSALYRPEGPDTVLVGSEEKESANAAYPNGITSVTWSRRSRTLLAGALGDARVRLIDTTHPLGPEECASLPNDSEAAAEGVVPSPGTNTAVTPESPLATAKPECEFMKSARSLESWDVTQHVPGDKVKAMKKHQAGLRKLSPESLPKRFPIISFSFPLALGGSLQIHPTDVLAGLAVLHNGSLVVFQAPSDGFTTCTELESNPVVKLATLWDYSKHSITCAAFDPHGEKLYAASKDGILMGFEVKTLFDALKSTKHTAPTPVEPSFRIDIPGGATAWHLLVSRNGRCILLNCADSALRVYNAQDCWTSPSDTKPKVFQDVVSKVPFSSCDFSGDAEYLVGGCSGTDKYDLYLWNATTGALMDRLTGPQVSLYSVAWHPTRSFLAVATSDGVVDIWGPRMDWTAFAPDFQALPMNVEYVEQEDEFDIVDSKVEEVEEEEDADVDVVKVEPVPVFASDSESESEVFSFETKIANIMALGKGRNAASVGYSGRTVADEKD
jgi:WD40 repeat protein